MALRHFVVFGEDPVGAGMLDAEALEFYGGMLILI